LPRELPCAMGAGEQDQQASCEGPLRRRFSRCTDAGSAKTAGVPRVEDSPLTARVDGPGFDPRTEGLRTIEISEQDVPERLPRKILVKNREYEIGSSFHRWRASPWKQVVLLEVAGSWEEADCPYYLKDIWDILDERRRQHATIYLLIDARNMALEVEEFQQTLLESWGHFLDRGELVVCPIEVNEAKRLI